LYAGTIRLFDNDLLSAEIPSEIGQLGELGKFRLLVLLRL
jgi:hypothetical protein